VKIRLAHPAAQLAIRNDIGARKPVGRFGKKDIAIIPRQAKFVRSRSWRGAMSPKCRLIKIGAPAVMGRAEDFEAVGQQNPILAMGAIKCRHLAEKCGVQDGCIILNEQIEIILPDRSCENTSAQIA
jgi:hypothetical protein